MQMYAAVVATKIGFPVETLVATSLAALNLLPRSFMLEHVATQVIDTLESLVAFIAVKSCILCCCLHSFRSV
mgnify:CR=1 FL=1